MKNLILIIFCVSVINIYSTVVYVPDDQPTIQEGINNSVDGDTVLVQPGIFLENINFNGKNITVASMFLLTQNSSYIDQTIIDGNCFACVVMFESGEDSTATLNGFTIQNGLGGDWPQYTGGGGITCYNNSNPILQNLCIKNNSASRGGGLQIDESDPTIRNSLIAENSGTDGAGIYSSHSILNIESTKINNNAGSGLLTFHTSLHATDCEFISNTDSGVKCSFIRARFNNCVFINNSAQAGGGIDGFNTIIDLNNIDFINNHSTNNGGAISYYLNGGAGDYSGIWENIIFVSNSADFSGGGVCISQYSPKLVNVLFQDNSAEKGGAIYSYDSNFELLNVTIKDNIASQNGGALHCKYFSHPSLTNCILWNNYPEEIAFDYENNSLRVGCSNIRGGFDNINTNGYATINWQDGNFNEDPLFYDSNNPLLSVMLQDDSPCINHGTIDTTGLDLPEYDLVGNPRIYGGRIDIGAYESLNSAVYSDYYQTPNKIILQKNYPNPFNPSTTIKFSIQEQSLVNLSIYNVKGQKIKTLTHSDYKKGNHSIIWNGKNDLGKPVSSGLYLYKLKINGINIATQKCLMMK